MKKLTNTQVNTGKNVRMGNRLLNNINSREQMDRKANMPDNRYQHQNQVQEPNQDFFINDD